MDAAGESGVISDLSQQPVGISKFEIVTKEMESNAAAAAAAAPLSTDGASSKKRKLSLSDEADEEDSAIASLSPKRCKIASTSGADSAMESSFDQNKSLAERSSFIETVEALSQIDNENPAPSVSATIAEAQPERHQTDNVAGHFVAPSTTTSEAQQQQYSSQVTAEQLPCAISIDQYRERSEFSQPASDSSQMSFSQPTTQEYAILSHGESSSSPSSQAELSSQDAPLENDVTVSQASTVEASESQPMADDSSPCEAQPLNTMAPSQPDGNEPNLASDQVK